MGVMKGCKPRREVLEGELEDAIFAADFGDLIAEEARTPKVYGDAKTFFANTHPAQDLKTIVQAVFRRLAKPEEAGATIRLSTGFGGGKTHTLMALWHLARNVGDRTLGTELLPAAGRPKEVTVVAVDGSKAGAPIFLRHGGVTVRSLQGEIAYQLGGAKAVKQLGKADDPEAQPDEQLLASLLPAGPVLFLLDEIVIYAAGLSDRGQANVLGFLNKLGAIAARRPQTVFVITDPGQQPAYQQQSAQLQQALAQVAQRLDDLLGRKATDFDPIGSEAARVIVRRLFERVDKAATDETSATYHQLYERVAADHPTLIPASALSPDYARRIVECYPFHPRLLDTAQNRLAALADFQRSRGVLRLFARILREVWDAKQDLPLITAGDIKWSSPEIRGDLLQRLNREQFSAAVSADIEGHACELDSGAHAGIHGRVASALLLESLPLESNSGLTPDDVTLAVLRPDEAGPEPAEALDRLVGVCWHTYPMPGGNGWQFRYQPNVIKQIEERRAQIPLEDAEARVRAEAQQYFGGAGFRLVAWPERPRQVPESPDLQLALCQTEEIATAVCAYVDDSEPAAPVPRRYQNAMVAVTATTATFRNAVQRAQGLVAAEQIEKDYRTGEQGKQIREQLGRLKPELEKQFRVQTRRAFDRVVLAGGQVYSIDESFQGPDEEILRAPRGQAALRRFLDDKELIYKQTDALDPTRFVRDVLPGTVPVSGTQGVYTAKAVYERLLAAPGLRLVPDGEVVRRSIVRAVDEGKLVLKTPDGRAYDKRGMVDGGPGRRTRRPGRPAGFPLSDEVLVATADALPAREWLAEDAPTAPGAEPPRPVQPPPEPSRAVASTWEQAIALAADRPLQELRLSASTPAGATQLTRLAQPFGADSLTLSISTGGELRTGGTMYFNAESVKPTHPVQPLETAQRVANSLIEGQSYEATLILSFGSEGRVGLVSALKQAEEAAPEDIAIAATFGPAKGT
jgi:hypothetical protein